jgi:hypothetical protein
MGKREGSNNAEERKKKCPREEERQEKNVGTEGNKSQKMLIRRL